MDIKWSALAEEEEAGGPVLPPTTRVDLDDKGRFLERKYWIDEQTGVMKMSERYAVKTRTTKKVAKSAIARRLRWVKFGEVAGHSMGVTEKGITSKKAEPTELAWDGATARRKKKKPARPPPPVMRADGAAEDEKKTARAPREVYRVRREGADVEKHEIKISNLPPDWGTPPGEEQNRDKNNAARDAIRELINAFYQNYLRDARGHPKQPPRRYRIKVWTDRRHGVHAAVEFDLEKDRNKAVEILDGHVYGHRALSVVKSKPRPRY